MFVGDGKSTQPIALDDEPAPQGGNYQILGTFELNDHGEVAFLARLTSGASGMFRSDGKRAITVALSGATAPGTAGTFESFGDVFKLGNDGRVAFVATLVPGSGGVDSSNNTGIWVGTTQADLKLLVRTGESTGENVLTGLPFGAIVGHPIDMNENSVLWRGNFGPVNALVLSRIPDTDDLDTEQN